PGASHPASARKRVQHLVQRHRHCAIARYGRVTASLRYYGNLLQCRGLSGGGRDLDLCHLFATPNLSRIDQRQRGRVGRTRSGRAPGRAFAMDCFCHFECCLAWLHSRVYFCADHGGQSGWFATSLASADFVFGFGFHRSDADVFSSRTGQSMGAFSRFLPRYPARPAKGNPSAFFANPRTDVGHLGGALSDWIATSADVRAAFAGLQSAVVCGLRAARSELPSAFVLRFSLPAWWQSRWMNCALPFTPSVKAS